MARSRIIKPGFFTNDILAEIPPLGRLLFAGLWTIADREGRLEDRPKRIKATLLPYDECNVDKLLTELASRGFIYRYGKGLNAFIQITNWDKHQQPHIKEAASTIPAPDEYHAGTVLSPDEYHAGTVLSPDEPTTSMVEESLVTSSISIPISNSISKGAAQAPPKRKTRAPDSYPLDESMLDFADRAGFRGDTAHLESVTASFLDHHAAKGTLSLDWRKSWQTWIRRSVTYGEDLPKQGKANGSYEAPAITAIKKGSFNDPDVRAKYEQGGKYGHLTVLGDKA